MDEAASQPGPGVLVVEDDGVQAFMIREALAGSGFADIRVATTAAEAHAELSHWTPDLVILDLGLPDADGLSILQAVGAGQEHGIPVLVVTGEADPERRVRALELGASDVVTKPFNLLELGVRSKRTLRAHDDLAAAGVLARSLAKELTEVSDELEHNLSLAASMLLSTLAMRSPALGTRARRVARSVHQLAVAVHLDDVAAPLGQAAACHEIGALTLTDDDLTGVLLGDPASCARCEAASEAVLAGRYPLAVAAARFRSPADSFDRQSHRVTAQLTAVCHTFHAAAQGNTFDAARGIEALRSAPPAMLDVDLVATFLDVCVPTATPLD